MSQKTLNVIALLTLLAMGGITAYALLGPRPLPPRIPTHFDLAGRVNGWGGRWTLCLAPGMATAIYALMSLTSRFPQAFNYPARATPATRPRMQAISLDMIAWLKAELACLFFWIQYATIRSAWEGVNGLSPWFVPCVLVVVFGTIAWHFVALIKASRAASWTDPRN